MAEAAEAVDILMDMSAVVVVVATAAAAAVMEGKFEFCLFRRRLRVALFVPLSSTCPIPPLIIPPSLDLNTNSI